LSFAMSASSTESVTDPEHVSHSSFEAPDLHEVAGMFPNYDIYSLIACGGMGAVYHAKQRSLDRDVGIKILPRVFSLDKEFRVSFEAEAKAMAKLNHPHLIGVYDFGEAAGLLYIVMEYVPCSSIYAISHRRVVHQDDALKMIIGICRGLAHAHEYGILHRDIKPSNILMDANANPKIGDFGLASSLGKQVEEGESIFGTPGYTAPEVIEPPHVFDHRADIFSVGVMLHEMLTGITPNGVDPIAPLPPTTNPKLRAIIQRAMHQNPAARHSSAEELAADLEKIGAVNNNQLLTGGASTQKLGKRQLGQPISTAASKGAGPVTLQQGAASGSRVARPIVLQQGAASGSRVATPMSRHRMVKPTSSSGGSGFIILVIIVVVVALCYILMKLSSEDPDTTEGTFPAGLQNPSNMVSSASQTPKKLSRRKTATEEGLKPKDDIDAFFVRVEREMKERIVEDISNYREELKTNTLNFETEAKQAINSAGGSAATSAMGELSSNMQIWKSQNYLISETLPSSMGKISRIRDIFIKSHAVQAKVRGKFDQRIRNEQNAYIRGLKKQIENYNQSRDIAAITMLEKEIARLGAEPKYYEFLMGL
jgi:serine/threonine protein kinase